jgi:hypothetical protein
MTNTKLITSDAANDLLVGHMNPEASLISTMHTNDAVVTIEMLDTQFISWVVSRFAVTETTEGESVLELSNIEATVTYAEAAIFADLYIG